MSQSIDHIVVLGGGTAGWLTASILAAEFDTQAGIKVTLIESPSTPTIGVGEGTWPSMRSTLLKIGIPEKDFISTCSATMKQGTLFTGWLWGGEETYYHPFTLPHGFTELNLAEHWSSGAFGQLPFASAVTPQFAVCEAGLAPKQLQVPDYAFTLNYGYHLDAAKFAELLRNHAVNRLGVQHVLTDVTGINAGAEGAIQSLSTTSGSIAGDFFVDCSGFRSLLIGEHYQVPLRSQRDILFNDSALAVQVPYDEAQSSIATTTRATAHQAGWFWDIGLQHRRGVGAVFSSAHGERESVERALDAYLRRTGYAAGLDEASPRLIEFSPGYRESFWQQNCVAIGLSAGFIEPLEASALVLIELSARRLAEQLPRHQAQIGHIAERFNAEFTGRWAQIIEFLKLHYVLSQRDDCDYWKQHRDRSSIPEGLLSKLEEWQYRCPWHQDEHRVDEMFPAASYQYVLYGMGFRTEVDLSVRRNAAAQHQKAISLSHEVQQQAQKLAAHLPAHRQLLEEASVRGFAAR